MDTRTERAYVRNNLELTEVKQKWVGCGVSVHTTMHRHSTLYPYHCTARLHPVPYTYTLTRRRRRKNSDSKNRKKNSNGHNDSQRYRGTLRPWSYRTFITMWHSICVTCVVPSPVVWYHVAPSCVCVCPTHVRPTPPHMLQRVRTNVPIPRYAVKYIIVHYAFIKAVAYTICCMSYSEP